MTSPAELLGQSSLSGVRVLEVGTSVAAPFGAQILGDLGADVVKIERLDVGDDTRKWTPPAWDGVSIPFLHVNRNKRSVVVDYKTDAGRAVMEELIAGADVLIQNLRPGAFARAGFSAERLRELNPRLVYVEMTGFGRTGPRAAQPAYDPLLQAYSGIVSMTGEDGGTPARVPVSVLDMGTGLWLVIAVYEALRRRDVTGVGTHVETSLLQTALMWMSGALMGVAAGHAAPRRLGSGFPGVVPYGAYPTSDGHVFLSAGNQATWLRLLEAIDSQDLDSREGFGSNPDRAANRETVNAALGERTSRFSTAELVARLEAAHVPHSPVQTVDQVLADEQVAALGQIQPLPHAQIPDLRVVNMPVTFDGDYPQMRLAPPELGEHTTEVLAELGHDAASIASLLDAGVIQTPTALEEEQTA
ncbi:CaiB/BaiF CoA-transferase family protein [Ornithinimicrobium humiphilum]|uniref:CaiB/BaiF CoA transferase family protein n=1 Tax=Ornithinimicrobium humiphilum TaxID=125288 RepID=UPI0031DE774E